MKKIFENGDKVAITGVFFPEYRDEIGTVEEANYRVLLESGVTIFCFPYELRAATEEELLPLRTQVNLLRTEIALLREELHKS